MSTVRWLAVFALLAWQLAGSPVRADEPGKVTGTSSLLKFAGKIEGKPFGFCGMCNLEIDQHPAAAFCLYQAPGSKAQYEYLLLFKPDPKGKRGSGDRGEGPSELDAGGKVKCDFKLHAMLGRRDIELRLQLDRDAKTLTKDIITIGGKDYGPDGPRVFLVDLAEEKPTPRPVKFVPMAVPDFGDEDAWGQQVLAAKKELIEKSAEARAFFAEK